jgi:hypothetical protein
MGAVWNRVTALYRLSSCPASWVEAMLQAEQVGCGDQCHVMVETLVGPALVVAQTKGLFHLAVVGLDAPAARV